MTIQRVFAENLREFVKDRRGLQVVLAKKLGIARGTISNIVAGNRGTTEDMRRQICDILEVNYDEMTKDNGDSHRKENIVLDIKKQVDYLARGEPTEEELTSMAAAVLSSKSIMFRTALITSVKAFYKACLTEAEMQDIKSDMAAMREEMRAGQSQLMKMVAALVPGDEKKRDTAASG
jgi:transcriptional regulator with XRE-family HTH domain